MRKGFTLVECLLAAGILFVMATTLFVGVINSAHVAHVNGDFLAAEAVAWDAVWKRFNEDFDRLALGKVTETLTAEQAPQLSPPIREAFAQAVLEVCVDTVENDKEPPAGFSKSPTDMVVISADVEWGPPGARCKLSDRCKIKDDYYIKVLRSRLGRSWR